MKRSRLDRDPDLDASRLGGSSMDPSGLSGTDPALDDPALDDTVAEVELDEALDKIDEDPSEEEVYTRRGRQPVPSTFDEDGPGYDPEAGKGSIANKTNLRGQLVNESSLFILGCLALLGGVSSVIFALSMQTRPYWIAAGIIFPPTLVWFIIRWKKWLGRAPYMYRLLTSLGEKDEAQVILEQHIEKQEAKVRAKIARYEAEGPADDRRAGRA